MTLDRYTMGRIRKYVEVMHDELKQMDTEEDRILNLRCWLNTVPTYRRLDRVIKAKYDDYARLTLKKARLISRD